MSRENFKQLLFANPNYFGQYPELKLPVVEKAKYDTTYEELECISYHPDTSELRAVIKIKEPSGYGSGSCGDGSTEYVRFFIDYHSTNTWIDLGLTSTNVHSLGQKEDLCYGVSLVFKPSHHHLCSNKALLPRVRAILSWNTAPTAGNPNFPPHWGDVKDVNIQIKPGLDKLTLADFSKLPVADLLKLTVIDLDEAAPTLPELHEFRQSHVAALAQKIEDHRHGHTVVNQLMKLQSISPVAVYQAAQSYKLNVDQLSKIIFEPQFNTNFEELTCVALKRETSELHGVIHIKLPGGYSGNLCKAGSKEYVAFYMDFGSGWEYMGTSFVTVHDIDTIPKDGLWYHAVLPVNLEPHQKKWCESGVARVRGILSWNVVPPPNKPEWIAPWGDREECDVEVKPLPKGVDPSNPLPVIFTLGGIQEDAIDHATGLANGTSVLGNGVVGVDSPFDGSIWITGTLPFAPPGSRYRIMIRRPGTVTYVPYIQEFSVKLKKWVVDHYITQDVLQQPDGDGWLIYREDFTMANYTEVIGDMMGLFVPNSEGLHSVYIEREGVVAPSASVTFKVDKSVPDVTLNITTGEGNCGDFITGDTISGSFTYADSAGGQYHNFRYVQIWAAPSGNPVFDQTHSTIISYPTLPDPAQLTWSLNTMGLPKCGYTISIHARNRTIVDSYANGRYDNDVRGFCLRES